MANKVKIFALAGADLSVPAALLMHWGGPNIVSSPCPSFLIEHPKGLLLFDSGCNAKILENLAGYWGEGWKDLPVKWSKDQTLDKQIMGLGYKLDDVKYVVLSHGHFDHTGGLTYFPKAKFIVGKGELASSYWPEPDRRAIYIMDDLMPTRGYNWLELNSDMDLFGDGTVKFLLTPGHTPGECSLLVTTASRKVLFTGDTVHLRAALDNNCTMPLDTDPVQAMASIQKLKIIRDMNDALVWITHDAQDWAEHPRRIE